MKIKKQLKSQFLVSAFCLSLCLGTFVSAYISVCLTQIAPFIKQKQNLSTQQFVWQLTMATSAFNFGSIIGPILYQICSIYIRIYTSLTIRQIIIVIDIISLLFTSILLTQIDFFVISVCRLVLGIFIGISTSLVPQYIKIISPTQIAGKMGTFNQLLQTFGVLFSCVLGFIVINLNFGDQIYWRIYIGCPILFIVMRLISLMYLMPYDHKNSKKLRAFISSTYQNNQQQLYKLLERLKNFGKPQPSSANNQGQQSFPKRFKLGIVLMISNQVTGINAIVLYLKQLIFKMFESSQANPFYLQTVMCFIAASQIVGTLWATVIVEKMGRKKIIVNGQRQIILILISMYFAHFLRYIVSDHTVNCLILILIMAHIIAHNRGLGAMAIVYCSDILDNLNWMIVTIKISSFTVALISEFMIEYLGIANMFLIFAALSILCHIYIFVVNSIVQTKGLSKKQIYALFLDKKNRENYDKDK